MGPIIYRPSPGFENNAWVIRALLDHGLTPESWFPCRSGRNPRFFLWIYFSDGKRYEYSTSYGRLGERELREMLGAAGVELQGGQWEGMRVSA
jgi:hypothetical protein